jgi:hypothetical protein
VRHKPALECTTVIDKILETRGHTKTRIRGYSAHGNSSRM